MDWGAGRRSMVRQDGKRSRVEGAELGEGTGGLFFELGAAMERVSLSSGKQIYGRAQ